jgi:hypothetical protein
VQKVETEELVVFAASDDSINADDDPVEEMESTWFTLDSPSLGFFTQITSPTFGERQSMVFHSVS